MLGCNSSFRRAALLDVGGFDEEYDYYLDETDVCLRLVDAGWVIRGLDGAPVHHKYLPSAIRTQTKVVTNNHSVIKNKIYFAMVNGIPDLGWTECMGSAVQFAKRRIAEMRLRHHEGDITGDGLSEGMETIESGWAQGITRGLEGRRKLLQPSECVDPGPIKPFPTLLAPDRMRLVLVTQGLPPEAPGGVGRYLLDLARGLSARGHEVRIITSGSDFNRVDLEEGVWIHRIVKSSRLPQPESFAPVPAPVWQNAGAVAAEVLRINHERPVDVVLSPIWDVEHLGVLALTSIPVITSFVTSFALVRRTQEDAIALTARDMDRREELEALAIERGHAFHILSRHVGEAVSQAGRVPLDPAGTFLAPLGTATAQVHQRAAKPESEPTQILFWGRFERRKGIDLLLGAIPIVAREHDVRFLLVGRDDLPNGAGSTYRAEFQSAHPDLVEAGRVVFKGEVEDEALADLLRGSDAAVLPSRFESFGLVFTEAMAAGLPVVALDGSGAEEVVVSGLTGLLCEPDAESLACAIGKLVDDPESAKKMGEHGRRRFDEMFTMEAMTDRVLSMLRNVSTLRPGDAGFDVTEGTIVKMLDGYSGLSLADRAEWRLSMPPGRSTVALTGSSAEAASDCEVLADGGCRSVSVDASEFRQVVVPVGSRSVLIRHLGGPSIIVAAVTTAHAAGCALTTSGSELA